MYRIYNKNVIRSGGHLHCRVELSYIKKMYSSYIFSVPHIFQFIPQVFRFSPVSRTLLFSIKFISFVALSLRHLKAYVRWGFRRALQEGCYMREGTLLSNITTFSAQVSILNLKI